MTIKELARSMQVNNNDIKTIYLIDSLTLKQFKKFSSNEKYIVMMYYTTIV